MSDSLSRKSWLQIERICCQFEDAWKAERAPDLEASLGDVAPDLLPALLYELVRVDLEYREATGIAVGREHYVSRFPDHADVIERAFQAAVDVDDSHTTAPDSRLPVGTRVGDLEIIEPLGHGGSADVYLARDVEQTPFALKVQRDSAKTNESAGGSFQTEAENLKAIDHPGLVRVLGAGHTESGTAFLKMEYVKGPSLKLLLESGDVSLEAGLRILAGVAEAAAHLHRHDLYHRDLKPANIIIQADGRPCIVDFGLTLSFDARLRHRDQVAGTIAYMAPEQVLGHTPRIDGRTDVWSLGVILYELLSGRRPFRAQRQSDVILQILDGVPVPPSQVTDRPVPHGLEQICRKALAADVADRYATADEFAAALECEVAQLAELQAETAGGNREEKSGQLAAGLAAQAHLWRTTGRVPGVWTWIRLQRSSAGCWRTDDERQMLKAARSRSLRFLAGTLVAAVFLVWLSLDLWNREEIQPANADGTQPRHGESLLRRADIGKLWEFAVPRLDQPLPAPLRPPSARIANGTLHLTNRGFAVTKQEFAAGVDLRFQWMWTDGKESYSDNLSVALHTDGQIHPVWTNEIEQGLVVKFTPFGDEVMVAPYESGTALPASAVKATNVTMPKDVWHTIRIVNNGGGISVFVNDSSKPVLVDSRQFDAAHHRIAFYNREAVADLDKASRIINLRVASPNQQTPDERLSRADASAMQGWVQLTDSE